MSTLGRILPLVLCFAAAPAAAAPARLGDFALGVGPALLAEDGKVGGGAVAEGSLLLGWFGVGARARVGEAGGELRPSAGIEASAFGLVGAGFGVQPAGPSVDLSVSMPLPVYRWMPFYLSVGWRPSFLLEGGTIHEVSLQLKWSSLLLPSDD